MSSMTSGYANGRTQTGWKTRLRGWRTPPSWLTLPLSLLGFLLAWHWLVIVAGYERFILPGPLAV